MLIAHKNLQSSQSQNCQHALLVVASYWFVPATYRGDKDARAMSYFANAPRDYHVEVIYWKGKQQWEECKCRDDRVLLTANYTDSSFS
jgi:hypothetical protein